MEKLDKFFSVLSYTKRLILQFRNPKNISHFNLIFHGFLPNRGGYYDFEKNGYRKYVTDHERFLKHTFINYKYKDLFRDKYANYIFLNQYTSKLVPIYGLVVKGRLNMVGPSVNSEDLLASGKKFVMKPRKGFGGRGVQVLQVRGADYFLNGQKKGLDEIFSSLDDYILVPFVYQDEYASRVNPNSLNTIRLLTAVLDDEVVVLGAFHRFGSSTTGNVDNFSTGGISAKINLQSGIIESAYCFDKKTNKKKKIEYHPDSKEAIMGLQIPKWKEIVEEIVELHGKIRFVRYIGWDIAITTDGYTIVESNDVTDVDSFQIHGPLLADEVNKRFYSKIC